MSFFTVLFILVLALIVYQAVTNNRPESKRRLDEPRDRRPQGTRIERRTDRSYRIEVRTGTSGRREQRRAPKQSADACWIPAGQEITVQGYRITRGMIYVGTGLYSDDYGWQKERCLIDSTLKVNPQAPDRTGEHMPYWPSYSEITPGARAAYLEWLADGAQDPEVYIGYVFLYLYGLERRLVKDRVAGERDALVREVERLKSIYGEKGTFGGYADTLLGAVLLLKDEQGLYKRRPDLTQGYEPRIITRLALAQAAVDGIPVDPDWMLSWLYEDPETHLRTPARRVPEEMRALFRLRFHERFPKGFYLKPNKTNLRVDYRAASGTFQTRLETSYPDIIRLQRPLSRVRPLLDACCDALDKYSRFVGRYPDKRSDRQALALLPAELARTRLEASDDAFYHWLREQLTSEEHVAVESDELARRWLDPDVERLTKSGALRKRDAEALAGYLDGLNIGMEPDVRITGSSPRSGQKVILYPSSSAPPAAHSEGYQQAMTVLKLIAAVVHADDEVTEAERQHLLGHLAQAQHLEPEEAERLTAHLHYLLTGPPSLRNVQQEIQEHIPPDARPGVAHVALLTAVADGYFDPAETRILQKIYELLGLDPEAIFSDLHALGAGAGLARVRSAGRGAPGFSIPKPSDTSEAEAPPVSDVVQLDMELVRAKMEDTRKASALLHDVFAEEPEAEQEGRAATDDGVFAGLGAGHAALLQKLLTQSSWTAARYRELAEEEGLLPGGALEAINEWAFERLDDVLIEGGDPIEIYHDLWQAYLHEHKAN